MEGIYVEYFPNIIDPGINETNSEFCSYISDHNEQDACDSHYHMIHLFKNHLFGNISVWHVNHMERHWWFCKAI